MKTVPRAAGYALVGSLLLRAQCLLETRAIRLESEARMAAAVTESLLILKTSSVAKRGDVLEPCIHKASKAVERQNPCVVMKRTD